jgi:AraC-like DNA-binding protein
VPLTSTTIGNGILIELAAYLKAHDVGFDRLRVAAGIDKIEADDPKQAFPLNAVVALFDHAGAALNDPCFGLKFAYAIRPGSSGLLGYLVLTAPTLRTALETGVRYFPAFATHFQLSVDWMRDPVELSWSLPSSITAPPCQFMLFLAASAVRWVRAAAGESWHPRSMRLEVGEPPCRDVVVACLGPTVTFRGSVNALEVEGAVLAKPMEHANPQLFRFLIELAEKWLQEGAHLPGLVGQVRGQLIGRFRSQGVELEQIAESLGMTARSLQWRLEQAGTTFEKVRDETRRSLAEHFLRDTDRPMVQIAHELGFSEQSAFTRAAHRWFDQSPKSYRRIHRKPPSGSAEEAEAE